MKRRYQLADTNNRNDVDLTEYADLIESVIQKECPDVKVSIEEKSYTVNKALTRGEAIRIGRALAKTELGKYCANRYVLFFGQTIEKGEENHGGNGKKGKKNLAKNSRK